MSDSKRILSYVRRACEDYNMIEDGDRIAVGISGGKDSMTLLTALAEMRRFYPRHYELCGISIDMGFEGMDFSPIAEYCSDLGVEYHLSPRILRRWFLNTAVSTIHVHFAQRCAAAR